MGTCGANSGEEPDAAAEALSAAAGMSEGSVGGLVPRWGKRSACGRRGS